MYTYLHYSCALLRKDEAEPLLREALTGFRAKLGLNIYIYIYIYI